MNHPFRKWAALLLLVLGGAVMGYFLMRKPATPDSAAAPAGIHSPIRKIVVLNSDALEALRILGADDRIVGVYSDIASEAPLWPDMAAKPHVGKWSEPNIEAIARLAPDVVIHYSGVAPHLETKLQPLGIGVLRMDLFRIDTLAQEMLQLGQALGKQPEAQRFNAWQETSSRPCDSRPRRCPSRPACTLRTMAITGPPDPDRTCTSCAKWPTD